MLSIVIVSGKPQNLTVESIKHCPYPHQLIIANQQGLGYARNCGASQCQYKLMIQFDDDLVLSPKIWSWLIGLKPNEFAMCKVGEHISSRVFACYLDNFWVLGGFDNKLEYIFEDGDFYANALAFGLKFRQVPNSLFKHKDHPVRADGEKWLGFNREYCKVFASTPRRVYRNPARFFQVPLHKGNRAFIYGTKTAVFRFLCVGYYLTVLRLHL